MRQTEKYQFNLLDGEDRLSPRPLNENMEAVEAAFTQKDLALLNAVGLGGHNARIAFGQYTGSGRYGSSSPTSVEVEFRPAMLAVVRGGGALYPPFVRPQGFGAAVEGVQHIVHGVRLTWLDRGVKWYSDDGTDYQLNADGTEYHWVAIGYDDTVYEGEAHGEA